MTKTATIVTPTMLADALESGEYTRYRSQLSAGPNSKSNCCLGVACRIGGIDLKMHDRWDMGNHLGFASDLMPWLSIGNGFFSPSDQVRNLLIAANDSHQRQVTWKTVAIPFLRLVKVNKNGELSKRQPKIVNECLKHRNTPTKVRRLLAEHAAQTNS